MKQQDVFKKIGVIIKELSDQYEYLKTIEGQLNELELELFIANSHFLTDHVVILNKLNAQMPPPAKPVEPVEPVTEIKEIAEEKPVLEEQPNEVVLKPIIVEQKPVEIAQPAQEPKYFEPLVQSVSSPAKGNRIESEDSRPTPHIDLEGSTEDSYAYMREEPETIRHELILDEADWADEAEEIEDEVENIQAEKPATSPVIAKPVIKTEEPKPVADKPAVLTFKPTPKEDVLTVNEKMSSQLGGKTGGFTEHAAVQKIDDLKQAITLNDKLLYIKDLFNGYNLAYSEAIEILNRFNSFDEADTFLKKNYVVKNAWESKPDTTEKFYALLKRRYA